MSTFSFSNLTSNKNVSEFILVESKFYKNNYVNLSKVFKYHLMSYINPISCLYTFLSYLVYRILS
jgi:hypothetical protein